jgi:hypothetical protein
MLALGLRRAAALTAAASFLGCHYTHVPSVPPPASMPAVDTPPPTTEGSGLATVIIGANVPARVERITHGTAGRRGLVLQELLCVETPCTVTLPYGDHELYFSPRGGSSRAGSVVVSVKNATEVVNHRLGEVSDTHGQALGGFVLVLGLTALVAGGVLTVRENRGHSTGAPAAPVLLGGLAGTIGGIVIISASPGTVQESATTQWSPAPGTEPGRTFGGSLGFRF